MIIEVPKKGYKMISEDGRIGKDDVAGPTSPELDPDAQYETAEWIFPASSRKDYHFQMNHERFYSWVK